MRTKSEQLMFLDTFFNRLPGPHELRTSLRCRANVASDLSLDPLSTYVTTVNAGYVGDDLNGSAPLDATNVHSIRSLLAVEPYKPWIARLQMWSAVVEECLDTKIIVEGRFLVSTDCVVSTLCLMAYSSDGLEGERYTVLSSVSAMISLPRDRTFSS